MRIFPQSPQRAHGRHTTRFRLSAVSLCLACLAVVACSPSGDSNSTSTKGDKASPETSVDSNFDLDDLVTAAKKEGSVNVYDQSGDVKAAAKLFQKKYGIKATGTKGNVPDTVEKVKREHQSGNAKIDAVLLEDGPSLVGQLAPKSVYTWIPKDLRSDIKSDQRNPLNMLDKAHVFAYNTKLYPDGCPIDNIWDLTKNKWRGRLVMQDPAATKPLFLQFFNQLHKHADQKMTKAYKDTFKKSLPDGDDATRKWVKGIAKNKPILTDDDGKSEDAVASPSQTNKRIGLYSNAKFRDIKEKHYPMSVCSDLNPWPGFTYPKYAAITKKTKHPNAAKLFVRFMLTQKGLDTEDYYGGVSPNTKLKPGPDPKGLDKWSNLFTFDNKTLLYDFNNKTKMQDFWSNHKQ